MKINNLTQLNTIIAASLTCLFSLNVHARSTELVEPDPVTIMCNLSAEKMKRGISDGGVIRGWVVVNQTPNNTQLKYVKGDKHTITVNVSYTENTYDITYKDSINLNYNIKKNGVRRLHPRPIGWMKNLNGDIQMTTNNQCHE